MGILASFSDRVYGYDYFISYAHAGGNTYPIALKDALEAQGFRVFIDLDEFGVGANLPSETARRIRMSSKLIVIGNEAAYTSKWVPREVETALSFSKPLILIDINGCFAATNVDIQLQQILSDQIHLAENTIDEKSFPSAHVLEELERSFQIVRRDTKRQRFFLTAAGVVTLISIGLASYAELNRRDASQKLEESQKSQSRFLANAAEKLILEHRPEFAAKLAYEALPDLKIGRKRPFVGSAQRALYKALSRVKLLRSYKGVIHYPIQRGKLFSGNILTRRFEEKKLVELKKINVISGENTLLQIPLENLSGGVLSNDGKYALLSYTDKIPILYDIATQKTVATIGGKGSRVHNGSLVAFGENTSLWAKDQSFTLWNIPKQKKLLDIAGAFGKPNGVLWSENGKIFAIQRSYRDIAIVDGKTGKILFEISEKETALGKNLQGIDKNIITHELSPDGHFLATVMAGGIYLWDIIKQKRTTLISLEVKLKGDVSVTHFSDDGKRLAVGFDDGSIRVWDTHQAKQILQDPPGKLSSINAIAFSGPLVIWGDDQGKVRLSIENIPSNNPAMDFPYSHRDSVTSIYTDRIGGLFTVGKDGMVAMFDNQDASIINRYEHGEGAIDDLFSIVERGLMFSLSGTTMNVWNLRGKRLNHELVLEGVELPKAVFSPDERQIYTYRNARLGVFDNSSGERNAVFEGHTKNVTGLTILPDGQLISTSWDGTLRVWNPADRTKDRILATFGSMVRNPVVSPDGKFIFVHLYEKEVRVLSIEDGTTKSVLPRSEQFRSVKFSPKGGYFTTSGLGVDTQIWDYKTIRSIGSFGKNEEIIFSHNDNEFFVRTQNGVQPYTLPSVQKSVPLKFADIPSFETVLVNPLVITKDGGRFYMASPSGSIVSWDRDEQRQIFYASDQLKTVTDMALIQDENVLVTVYDDGLIKIWDALNGELIDSFSGHSGTIVRVNAGKTGKYVVTTSRDETIRIWSIPDYNLEALISQYKKRISSPLSDKERCLYFLSDRSSC